MELEAFDWNQVVTVWEKWWQKELGRPLFQVSVAPPPDAPPPVLKRRHRFFPMYDFAIPASEIVREITADSEAAVGSCRDGSYPAVWFNFGPGVLASMIGGEGRCGKDTVWFYPGRFEGKELADMSLELDRESPWFRRLEEFFRAGAAEWHGRIHLGQTDLGGSLDVVSALRPGEALLFDLFDCPGEVKRLNWEVHRVWFEAFDYFNSLLPADNHGFSAWAGLLSQKSHYMLQCDFAYMISPDQFAEFVAPELAASCRRIERPFYHLDGKGQLPHLDHLLAIPELAGIQWVPGAGAPDCSCWPEVYRKIAAADRLMQIFVPNDVAVIEKVLTQIDKPELILFSGQVPYHQRDRLEALYRRFGVEV